MSDYVMKKVVRYPIEKEIFDYYGITEEWDIVEKFQEIDNEFEEFPHKNEIGFESTYDYDKNESKYYIDYVISYSYGGYSDDFGISQLLTKEQQEKYRPMFEKYIPNFDADKFRLVKFCYYNGVDCPDYYEVTLPMSDEDEE